MDGLSRIMLFVLIFAVFSSLFACSGQQSGSPEKENDVAEAVDSEATIAETGENIMEGFYSDTQETDEDENVVEYTQEVDSGFNPDNFSGVETIGEESLPLPEVTVLMDIKADEGAGYYKKMVLMPGDSIKADIFFDNQAGMEEIGIRLGTTQSDKGYMFSVISNRDEIPGYHIRICDGTNELADGSNGSFTLMLARGRANDQDLISWFLKGEKINESGICRISGLKPDKGLYFGLLKKTDGDESGSGINNIEYGKSPYKLEDKQYFTVIGNVDLFKKYFEKPSPDSKRMIGFAAIIYPFYDVEKRRNNTLKNLRDTVEFNLDIAEKSGYPVFFQVDDFNFPVWGKDGKIMKWSEWIDWSEEGEEMGPLAPSHVVPWAPVGSAPPPNFEDPDYLNYTKKMIEEGIAKPIAARLKKWAGEGKLHLFAGIAIGWESEMFDSTWFTQEMMLPKDDGTKLTEKDKFKTGYAALTSRGYTKKKIEEEAQKRGITYEKLKEELLWDIVYDYQKFMGEIYVNAGIPRERLYSHYAPISTTKFTFDVTTSAYFRAGGTMAPTFAQLAGTSIERMIEGFREAGSTSWAAPEFETSFGNENLLTEQGMYDYLNLLFDNGCMNATIWGWWLPDFWNAEKPVFDGMRKWLNE